ncbi:MAG TPA: hypothetical protein VGH28_26810 [Polyangiaceae bacterium]
MQRSSNAVIPRGALLKLQAKTFRAEKTIRSWWRDPSSIRPGIASHLAEAAAELGLAVPQPPAMVGFVTAEGGDSLELPAHVLCTPAEERDGDARHIDVPPGDPSRRWLRLDEARGLDVYAHFHTDTGFDRVHVDPKPEPTP